MNNFTPYDPEDLEALMLNKTFDELLPDEKTFVLQHLSGKREYESLRQLLFQSMETMQNEKPEPPEGLKHRVMHEFHGYHQRETQRATWLNFLSQYWIAFKSRPAIQLATACVTLLFVVVLWNPFPGESNLAESVVKEQQEKPKSPAAAEDKSEIEESATTENEVDTKPETTESQDDDQSSENLQTPPPPEEPEEHVVVVEEDVAEMEDREYSAGNAAPAAASDQFQSALADSDQDANQRVDKDAFDAEAEKSTAELVDENLLSLLFTAR